MVELLLAKGAAVNVRDNDGYTPLMFCVLKNGRKLAEMLVQKGADVSLKNKESKTALNTTSEAHSRAVMEFLAGIDRICFRK